ncbi:MAG TPA: dihydroorotate dehydrogenase (quinone), partial [Alphaproteobacteria bacterium]|nr:dihydroorotate dehydrogenase (quinone) [Alphaproteobacteria bacterium]
MNPFLLLPPETAHGLTLALLKTGLVPKAAPDPASLQVKLLGKVFTNPIGLSAGADKRAESLSGWQALGFGFVEAGTLTLHPRAGNPSPRLWRFPDQNAVINWLGLPSAGPDVFVENLKAYRARASAMHVGVSLASPEGQSDDFKKLAAMTAPLADYLALNISCPNTEDDMAGTLASLKGQIAAIRSEAGACPVMVKLGPTGDTDSLRPLVLTALEAGAAGFIATNTVPFDKHGLLNGAVPNWPLNAQGQHVGGY